MNIINNATTASTKLLGDFNLDENKCHQDIEELIGHHRYVQHVKEATWERVIQDRVKNSILDHIYCTDNRIVGSVLYIGTIYGDHKKVILCTSSQLIKRDFKIWRRNWKTYSVDVLVQNLNQVRWGTDIDR